MRPRVLHVTHSLGGGLGRWAELFFDGARDCRPLFLRSIGTRGAFGSQLWLYDDPRATTPIEVWKLGAPIASTATRHLGYRDAIDTLIRDYGVSAVLVSSLVGHSLDVLATGKPTALICHDYYPACPALHIHFGEVCRSCEPSRLERCLAENPLNDLFDERDPRHWLALRAELFAILGRGEVRMVAPSPSVERHFKTLFPELAGIGFAIVPHGIDVPAGPVAAAPDDPPTVDARRAARKLRVVIPGRLTAAKGGDLFRSMIDPLLEIAEVHLLGCGEGWSDVRGRGIAVVEHYEPGELGSLLARLRPDLALLLSIVPETWSLTLEECMGAQVPALATRVGSFEDRIEDGVNGFLCEPAATPLIARLASIAESRASLEQVRKRLAERASRSAGDMVADYERLLELPRYSRESYFAPFTPGLGARLGGVRLPRARH